MTTVESCDLSSNYSKINYFKVVVLKINLHLRNSNFNLWKYVIVIFMIVGQNFDFPTVLF
jgi:hypothetical protein